MKRFVTSRRRFLLVLYLLLLVASHAWRRIAPADGQPSRQQEEVQLPAIDRAAGFTGRVIHMAYRDSGADNVESGEVLVLLHGTPMAGASFNGLGPVLAQTHRVIVPDLPGFGGSSLRIPDYSIQAHARYLLNLVDRLGIDEAHLVAYSQGGGVALEFAECAPERVKSLTLLSAIGVQELELLGDYHLNQGLYLLQRVGLTLLQEGIPHFGWMDDALLNVAYARNFSDTDQRPLRGILERLEFPTLILHGESDRLVPSAAAREHHRLVPQSELEMYEGGHGLLFAEPHQLGERILRFVDDVVGGRAVGRANADAARVLETEVPFDWSGVPRVQGFTLLVLLVLLALATWVTEDLTSIAAGLMVARGLIGFMPATLACLVGIYSGDLLLFFAGKYLGGPLVRRAPFRYWISDEDVDRSRKWFVRKGPIVILASRFLPGTRLPTYVTAGMLQTPFVTFSFYFLLAAFIWTPLLVGAASLVGMTAITYLEAYQVYSLPVAIALGVLLWAVFKILLPCTSFRGRRLLIGRWRRVRHWEFWPPWLFYPPIVLYVLYLGIKHRGLTTFTAANPAMPAGGFIGESKSRILAELDPEGNWTAKTLCLPVAVELDEQVAAGLAFIENEGLSFPVVLKPDAGQRGEGVCVVRSEAELRAYLSRAKWRVLIQEYAPGHELGVFYFRRPDEERGHIFSVTDKRFPSVQGDGHSTLEQLILNDERAVCMARRHLAVHAGRLDDVPEPGEVIPLVELGTHCLGAIFLDGGSLVTPEAEEVMDRISRGYDGFFFGRYDLRVSSPEAFQNGTGFKIIELNGVTSEATNIYDPSNRLLDAWRVLRRQWALCFEIGAVNRARGVPVAGPVELLRAVRRYEHKATTLG